MRIRLGTRGSALALWQANHVRERLEKLGATVEIVTIKTTGDRILDRPLADVGGRGVSPLPSSGGKGLFLKEIEEAMLAGEIDAAVHSLKDVPWQMPAGLRLCAYLPREDPRDALVSRDRVPLAGLGAGARVGTTSLRRVCQLRARRPDLRIEPLRGNVDTRLRKVGRGDVDAAILALAGLRRLGLLEEVAEVLALADSLPAPGQGVMAVEAREGDIGAAPCAALDHAPTAIAARAERAVLEALGGDCHVPVAAHARVEGARVRLQALVGRPDGSRVVRDAIEASADDPREAGLRLGARLLDAGAREILDEIARGPG